MEAKLIEKEGEQPVVEKKSYSPPVLIIYGKLSDLTGGGTGASAEAGPPGQQAMQLTKHP